jgi:uncharacterized cupin superfamily protein
MKESGGHGPPPQNTVRKVNVSDIKEEPWQLPRGKYAASFKGISEALGRNRDSLDLAKRHPFDLEITRLPPGKMNFPYHAHSAQWELYLVISGRGIVRHSGSESELTSGDAFIFGPNEPHQIKNNGGEDLVYYVIADNPIGDSGYFPGSSKWKVNKLSDKRVDIKGRQIDYFEGEE